MVKINKFILFFTRKRDKNDFLSFFGCFFIVCTFLIKAVTDITIVKNNYGGFFDDLKYLTLFLSFIFFIPLFIHKSRKKIVYEKEFLVITFQILFLFFLSLLNGILNGSFSFSTFAEVFLTILPLLFAFVAVNSISKSAVHNTLLIILFIYIINYIFIEIGIDNFNYDNFSKISFADSFSPFESQYSASIFYLLCCYFIINHKHFYELLLAFAFTILTFKRPFILGAIVLFLFSILIRRKRERFLNGNIFIFFSLFFFAATVIYLYILEGKIFNISFEELDKFTMGRASFLKALESDGYVSSGLGTIQIFLGKELEMDLIRILLETNVIGLFVVCFSYFYISRKSSYSLLFMFFIFLTLLTSHILNQPFSRIIIYFVIFQ